MFHFRVHSHIKISRSPELIAFRLLQEITDLQHQLALIAYFPLNKHAHVRAFLRSFVRVGGCLDAIHLTLRYKCVRPDFSFIVHP